MLSPTLQPPSLEQQRQRKPSRFEVTNEAGATFVPDAESDDDGEKEKEKGDDKEEGSALHFDTDEDDDEVETEDETPAMKALRQLGSVPKKSILKKSNSYTIHAGQRGYRDDSPETLMREEARRRLRQEMAGNNRSPYTTVTGAEKIRYFAIVAFCPRDYGFEAAQGQLQAAQGS